MVKLMAIIGNPKKALDRIDKLFLEIDVLLSDNYVTGEDQKQKIDSEIEGLISATFSDSQEKLKNYNNRFYFAIIGREKTSMEKQKDYTDSLKRMKDYLQKYKTEIELQIDTNEEEKALTKVELQTRELQKEKQRISEVVKEKELGATIELLTILRDEIKRKGIINIEIVSINKNIAEIKDMLIKINEKLDLLDKPKQDTDVIEGDK